MERLQNCADDHAQCRREFAQCIRQGYGIAVLQAFFDHGDGILLKPSHWNHDRELHKCLLETNIETLKLIIPRALWIASCVFVGHHTSGTNNQLQYCYVGEDGIRRTVVLETLIDSQRLSAMLYLLSMGACQGESKQIIQDMRKTRAPNRRVQSIFEMLPLCAALDLERMRMLSPVSVLPREILRILFSYIT